MDRQRNKETDIKKRYRVLPGGALNIIKIHIRSKKKIDID